MGIIASVQRVCSTRPHVPALCCSPITMVLCLYKAAGSASPSHPFIGAAVYAAFHVSSHESSPDKKGATTLCLKTTVMFHTITMTVMHEGILIILSRYVTKKISYSKLLYFSTSHNWCFYTTWWNRKPRNCVFLLKCLMLFSRQTQTFLCCQNDRPTGRKMELLAMSLTMTRRPRTLNISRES